MPYTSGEWPISRECSDLEQILAASGCPWLVLGGRIDRRTGKNSLSAADAAYLIGAGERARCKIFYTSEAEKLALEKGDGPTQLLSEIRLDSMADQRSAGYFARYREIPEFRRNPVKTLANLCASMKRGCETSAQGIEHLTPIKA